MSNLCQLLDSLFWILDEKNHIQELAGISGEDYTAMYKLFLSDKMDTSIIPDSLPKKFPQAPRRSIWRNTSVSSYSRSLRSLRSPGNAFPQVGQGSTSKRHRPKRHTRARNAPKNGGQHLSFLGKISRDLINLLIYFLQTFQKPSFSIFWQC